VARTLLVLRALGLGDLLTAVPALRALRRAHRTHRLVLAAPPALEPLAALTGAVDALLPAQPLQPLPPEADGADLAVNLHGRGPESHRVLLDRRPQRLIAFAHPDVPATEGAPPWRRDEHEVIRWCRLLRESGIPTDPAHLHLDGPNGCHGATVLHPGAASPARRWPVDRWVRVAAAERAARRRVVVTGGPGEVELAAQVAEDAGLLPEAVLAGRTDLLELAEVVAGAGAVVAGDTGVAHLATAFGRPSVTLFGPTPPAHWGPPANASDRHLVLWKGTTGDPHADRPDPGLLRIQPDEVIAALRRLR
jgi:ADP-heptose:LPS heptosyltransferase